MKCGDYHAKRLSIADVGLLKDLLRVFGEAFCEVETYQHARPSDAYLAELLAKSHVVVVVATLGGRVVGGLTAYQLDKFEQERREMYIYDLAVAEDHRRRGVARMLIDELRTIATQRGVYVIFVQADLVDAPAIALYESVGIKETVHHFDIAVGAPPCERRSGGDGR